MSTGGGESFSTFGASGVDASFGGMGSSASRNSNGGFNNGSSYGNPSIESASSNFNVNSASAAEFGASNSVESDSFSGLPSIQMDQNARSQAPPPQEMVPSAPNAAAPAPASSNPFDLF
jgi:hypothetical protein